MRPTITDLLSVLGASVDGDRFNHCGGSQDTTAKINDDHRFHCWRCGANGDFVDLIESYGLTGAQRDDFLAQNFPHYDPVKDFKPVPLIKKSLTPFVQLAHQYLIADDPRIQEIRQWMYQKWELSLEDIYLFNIGLAVSPMVNHLPVETLQAMETVGIFNHNQFKLNRYLVFPEFERGYVKYFQGRSTDDSHPEKHWKPTGIKPETFGYTSTEKMIRSGQTNKPLIVVEGICDYYTMTKMRYPSLANLSAGSNQSSVIAKIKSLHANLKGTIIEFDSDASSQTGTKAARVLAESLCHRGVDPVVSITHPSFFLNSEDLPPLLHQLPKLDVTELAVQLGRDVAQRLLEQKHQYYLDLNENWEPLNSQQGPRTFLREFIRTAQTTEQYEKAYEYLTKVPELNQASYYRLINSHFKHKEADIKKNLSRTQAKLKSVEAQEFEIVEEEEFNVYKRDSHDYVYDPLTRNMYATKCGFIKVKKKTKDGPIEEDSMLCTVTVKNWVNAQGQYCADLFNSRLSDPMGGEIKPDSYTPVQEIPNGAEYPTWMNPLTEGKRDPFSIAQIKNGLGSALTELSPAEIYIKLYNYFKTRVFFVNPLYPHLCALYSMMTYVYRLFPHVPYIHIQGVKNSGKSTLMACFADTCFKPMMTVGATPASLFQIIHMHSPTLLLDEEDGKNVESRLSEREREIKPILNQGYYSRGMVLRRDTSKTGAGLVISYDIFGPKVFAGTKGFYDTLKSRCIPIQARPASEDEQDLIEYVDPQSVKVENQLLANQLTVWSLVYPLQIKAQFDFLVRNREFKRIAGNRYTDLYAPLIAILRSVGDPYQVEGQLLKFIQSTKVEHQADLADTSDFHILRALNAIYLKWMKAEGQEEALARLGIFHLDEELVKIETSCIKKQIIEYHLNRYHETLDFCSTHQLVKRLQRLSVGERSSLRSKKKVQLLKKHSGVPPRETPNGDLYDTIVIRYKEVITLLQSCKAYGDEEETDEVHED